MQLQLGPLSGLPLSDAQLARCLELCQTIGDEDALLPMLARMVPLDRAWSPPVVRAAGQLLIRTAAQGHLRLCQFLCALGAPAQTLLEHRRAWDDPSAWPAPRVARFYEWLACATRRSPAWVSAAAGLPDVLVWHLRTGGHGAGVPLLSTARQHLLEFAITPALFDPIPQLAAQPWETVMATCRAAAGSWSSSSHHLAPREARRTAFFFLLMMRRLQATPPRLHQSVPHTFLATDPLQMVTLALGAYTGVADDALRAFSSCHNRPAELASLAIPAVLVAAFDGRRRLGVVRA